MENNTKKSCLWIDILALLFCPFSTGIRWMTLSLWLAGLLPLGFLFYASQGYGFVRGNMQNVSRAIQAAQLDDETSDPPSGLNADFTDCASMRPENLLVQVNNQGNNNRTLVSSREDRRLFGGVGFVDGPKSAGHVSLTPYGRNIVKTSAHIFRGVGRDENNVERLLWFTNNGQEGDWSDFEIYFDSDECPGPYTIKSVALGTRNPRIQPTLDQAIVVLNEDVCQDVPSIPIGTIDDDTYGRLLNTDNSITMSVYRPSSETDRGSSGTSRRPFPDKWISRCKLEGAEQVGAGVMLHHGCLTQPGDSGAPLLMWDEENKRYIDIGTDQGRARGVDRAVYNDLDFLQRLVQEAKSLSARSGT